MKHDKLLAVVLAAMLGSAAYAQEKPSSVRFQHKDWELACDNTRTCRAAGYGKEYRVENSLISVLLTRPAGANAKTKAQLQLMEDHQADGAICPRTVYMQGIAKPNAAVRLGKGCIGTLNATQLQFLLQQAATESSLAFRLGNNTSKKQWDLSLLGARAVLLKTDEAQGRLHTPSAWVRKGKRSNSRVLPPVPAPVIRIPKISNQAIPNQAAWLRTIAPALQAGIDEEICLRDDPLELDARLNATHALVSRPCWQAAYNYGRAYWVVEIQPPYKATLLTTDGSDYDKGIIYESHKGRGVGDCWSYTTRAWNGKRFVLAKESTTGMCRGFAGGAWDLPTYTTTIQHMP